MKNLSLLFTAILLGAYTMYAPPITVDPNTANNTVMVNPTGTTGVDTFTAANTRRLIIDQVYTVITNAGLDYSAFGTFLAGTGIITSMDIGDTFTATASTALTATREATSPRVDSRLEAPFLNEFYEANPVPASAMPPTTNIFNSDGSLTADRTLTLGSRDLTIGVASGTDTDVTIDLSGSTSGKISFTAGNGDNLTIGASITASSSNFKLGATGILLNATTESGLDIGSTTDGITRYYFSESCGSNAVLLDVDADGADLSVTINLPDSNSSAVVPGLKWEYIASGGCGESASVTLSQHDDSGGTLPVIFSEFFNFPPNSNGIGACAFASSEIIIHGPNVGGQSIWNPLVGRTLVFCGGTACEGNTNSVTISSPEVDGVGVNSVLSATANSTATTKTRRTQLLISDCGVACGVCVTRVIFDTKHDSACGVTTESYTRLNYIGTLCCVPFPQRAIEFQTHPTELSRVFDANACGVGALSIDFDARKLIAINGITTRLDWDDGSGNVLITGANWSVDASGNITLSGTVDGIDIATDVAANTLKVSASGSVTSHSDMTSAGSGAIITGCERTSIGDVTTHRIINDSSTSTIELFSADKILALTSTAALGVTILASADTSDEGSGAIALSGLGASPLNGVTLVDGVTRVIIAEQGGDPLTPDADNGIYVVSTGAWTRATDLDSDSEIHNGVFVSIENSNSTHFRHRHVITTLDPISIGVTAFIFSEFSAITFGTTAGTNAEGNDSRIPTQDENDALVGTNGTPSTSNKYVTNSDSRNSDERTPVDDSATNAKLANMAQNTIKGRITASTGDPEDLTPTQVRTIINVENGATADQTSIVGITGTKTQFDTALTDADFLFDDGGTATGVYDFGGTTSFEITNAAAPVVDAAGEIAIDTAIADFSNGVIRFFGSAEEFGVVAMPIAQFTSPTDGHVVTYNAANNEFGLAAAGGGGALDITRVVQTAAVGSCSCSLGDICTGCFVIAPPIGTYLVTMRAQSEHSIGCGDGTAIGIWTTDCGDIAASRMFWQQSSGACAMGGTPSMPLYTCAEVVIGACDVIRGRFSRVGGGGSSTITNRSMWITEAQ